MPGLHRDQWYTAALLPFTLALLCSVSFCPAATPPRLSLHIESGQLVGLNVDGRTLPAEGIGGFYVQPYQVVTGPNLLRERGLAGLPRPLPEAFAVDPKVKWKGRPTLTIKLPEGAPASSGELELHVDKVTPHRTYLLRFAHRGQRLDGEYPPIIHIRQYDQAGDPAWPQLNLDLLAGSYDWKVETVAITAVERAARFSLMLHHPSGMGQFWISEMSLQEVKPQPALPVPGRWHPGATPSFTGTISGTPIRLTASAAPHGDQLTVRVGLSAPTAWLRSHPTAMVLGFRLPLKAVGWRWGDYLRRERTIEPGKTYSYYQIIGRRQFREVSRFPLAPVAGPGHGIALAVPLKPTLLNRLRYDADGYLCAEFDLGLAARSGAATEALTFSFDLLRFDPRWGYRSALAAYYHHYPELFASSAKQGGWWIGPTEKLTNLQDFGLQYSEQHFARADRTKAEDEMGLYTCSYSEPWMWRITASEQRKLSLAKPLSHYLPEIERDAFLPDTVTGGHDYWPAPRRDSVRAFLNSVIFGPDGKYQQNATRTYAGTFIEMSTSPLPRIRSSRWGDMNRGLLSYRYETLEDAKRCAAGGAKLDGVYFDSVGNWSDISAEDHRADHFPFATYPLTFSYATGKPVISGLAAMAEYMDFIRQKNRITMANSDDSYVAYAAPFLDMLGAGENFYQDASSDQALTHDRAVAYHKSVSFGNSGLLSISPEEAESRFRLLLCYHIYPGIFFSGEEELERARPIYQRYIPLMRAMGQAGWEPIPWAALDDPALWVERYGPGPDGVAYFALRNPADGPRAATLTIEASGLGRAAPADIAVTEALSGRTLTCQQAQGNLLVPVELPPHDTIVVRVAWSR